MRLITTNVIECLYISVCGRMCSCHIYVSYILSATGLEEIRKLKVQLQSLYEQVSTGVHTTLQPFKKEVKSSYTQCCALSQKIEKEQSAYEENIEQLRKDKSQLEKAYKENIEQLRNDKSQLEKAYEEDKRRFTGEIKHLRKQLAERGICSVSQVSFNILTYMYY